MDIEQIRENVKTGYCECDKLLTLHDSQKQTIEELRKANDVKAEKTKNDEILIADLRHIIECKNATIAEQAKKIEELEAEAEGHDLSECIVSEADEAIIQHEARRSTIDAVIEAGNRMDAGGIAVTEPVIIIPLSVLESMKGEPHDKK